LNDLRNVLWIVSEEAPANSTWWNNHEIAHTRAYESKKPHQHPIGYAALIGSTDATLYNSDADWVAPGARISPAESCGSGHPPCKVNVERYTASKSQLCVGKPLARQPGAVHGSLCGVLPARKPELVRLSHQRDLQRAGQALRQLQGQSRVHSEIFPQAKSCQGRSKQFSLVDRVLPCSDPAGWSGIPSLRSIRWFLHREPLSYVQIKNIVGTVVQPIHRSGDPRRCDSRWIIVPNV
jgi:hypothetical protein